MAKAAHYEGPEAETRIDRAVAGCSRVELAALAAAADSSPATAVEVAAPAAADSTRAATCAGMAALVAAVEGNIPATRAGMDKTERTCAPSDTVTPATGDNEYGPLQASLNTWGLAGRVSLGARVADVVPRGATTLRARGCWGH